jgi:hypothetical protein
MASRRAFGIGSPLKSDSPYVPSSIFASARSIARKRIYRPVDFALSHILGVLFHLLRLSGFGRTLSAPACAQQLVAHSGEALALLFQEGWISDGVLLAHQVLHGCREHNRSHGFSGILRAGQGCGAVELTRSIDTVTLQLSASRVLVRRASEAVGRLSCLLFDAKRGDRNKNAHVAAPDQPVWSTRRPSRERQHHLRLDRINPSRRCGRPRSWTHAGAVCQLLRQIAKAERERWAASRCEVAVSDAVGLIVEVAAPYGSPDRCASLPVTQRS